MWFAPSPPPLSAADHPSNVPTDQAPSPVLDPLNPETVADAAGAVTSLHLSVDQESAMVQRALDRINELRSEMGIEPGGSVTSTGWAWEREKNQNQYDNDWRYRAAMGGIFSYSNFSLNIAKRYARLMAAKTTDDLIGTDPFFAAMPNQHGDPQEAKQAEWYLQEKVSQSNAKEVLADAEKIALVRNESVVKISWTSAMTKYRGPATVAVGPFLYRDQYGTHEFQPGEPVVTSRGEYIYEKDDVIADQNTEGLFRLMKEPQVQFAHALVFAKFEMLEQRLTRYEGLDLRVLDYRDFLCPLNCANIHEADINVHLFDEQHEILVANYGMFAVSSDYVNMPYLSGEKQPKEQQGEVETSASQALNIVNCADVYMRMDVDGDGIEEEIWLVLDLRAQKAIWYDYLGNHMGKRPFEVITGVEKVPNRWYGTGVFEMLAHKQLYIDTQFNRVNFKSSKSSSVRFRVKNAVAQWKSGQKVVVGDDQIFDVEDPRFDAKNPPLYQVNLTEIDQFAMKLIELMIQAGSTEVGIVGPDDGAMSGLESTKLAAGIKSLERTGNVLMKFTERDHGQAISAILDQAVEVILEHMDENELLFHPDSDRLVQLNRGEIRRMKQTVRLLLTRSRSTETIQTARMVIQLCREYYEALNPYEKMKLRDEYLRQLKALETPDADSLLDEVTPAEVEQWKQEQANAANLPPKTSVATKYPDLARSEQVQILQKEGIQPASPEELMEEKAQAAALELQAEQGKAGAQAAAKIMVAKETPKPATNGGKKPA